MKDLARRRCFNHPRREAAARCPECGRFFCRECITEHEDRVLCSNCLKSKMPDQAVKRRRFSGLKYSVEGVLGVWLAWVFMYYLSRFLVALPSSFHEGSIWREIW